jgi:SAM-dependent methyltransferase
MDAPDTDYETFRGCLQDLARVNRLSLGYRPTLAFLARLRQSGRLDLGRPVEILDVGCGYGDLLRAVDCWAERHGVPVRLTGLDLSPWSARAAQEATAPGRAIRWITGDVFAHNGPSDLILSSLFAHHLQDRLVVHFLRWMEGHAKSGWFINDLHRHPVPFRTFGPLAAALRLHVFVRHDGPISFARAFTPDEWHGLLSQAGVPTREVLVEKWAPYRLCVARAKAA